MARVAYGRRTTRVNTSSYPDDGSSPVGTNEWNADPESTGLFGFTKIGATLDGSGVLSTKDDSTTFTNESGSSQEKQSTVIEVECNSSSTTDAVEKISITDTNENDIVYLFKGTDGDTVTVSHTSSLAAAGQIQTLDAGSATLNDAGKPISLIRRGNYWFEFGGGGASTPTDITVADTTDTTCFPALFESATGDLAPKTDAGITYNAGTGALTATSFAGALTNCTALPAAQVAQGTMASGMVLVAPVLGTPASGALTNCTALPAAQVAQGTMASGMVLVAPALGTPASGVATNLTGTAASLTAGIATTVADNAITLAKLAGGTDGELITYDASGDPAVVAVGTATHVLTSNGAGAAPTFQATAGGGATAVHAFTNTTTTGYLGTASSFGTVGAGDRDIYIKKIDANNEGVFSKIWKNGSATEVQLA